MRAVVSKIALLVFGASMALSAGAVSASATAVFLDGDFNSTTLSPVYASGPSNVTTSIPCPSCGQSGGAGLGVQFDFTSSNAGATTAGVGVVENGFHYNPATQGVITSIDTSADKRVVVTGPASGYVNVFRPLIEQGGNYYLGLITINPSVVAPGDTGYQSTSGTGLTASDFSLFSFATGTTNSSSHPDFAGSVLHFGVATIFTLNQGDIGQISYDNLGFTVNSVAPTPIPGGLPLLATALAATGFVARRKKRKAA